ncbi:MAG: thiamine biosynthesis lipoprotein [Candidatus Aldehydirespiratoraceae bacterium]|jgi:thiamine biosynthesis lipoprotein
MGGTLRITTTASIVAVRAVETVVATLERRWSRFRPDSELSRCNRAAGPAVVRPSTARIIEVALAGRELTDGWFDPTRGRDIAAAGYAHSIDRGWTPASDVLVQTGDVVVDADSGLLHLPENVALDLGGIAKGWAADLAATILFDSAPNRDAGRFAAVSVGGDVRVKSATRAIIEVEAPDGSNDRPLLVGLKDGGVAVSGPTKRATVDGRHHLIDPFTQRPAAEPRVAVVIAATTAGAEMLATAAAIAPLASAFDIIGRAGATAWLVERDGSIQAVGQPERFLLDLGWATQPRRARWGPRDWTA